MMYNPQLETFICVVESGSFNKAAEKLYISAPAVIKQINSLEKSLNLQLFERTHRGLQVTSAGGGSFQGGRTTSILQGVGCQGRECDGGERRSNPCRSFSDDTAAGICEIMARDTENQSRYQISDDTF